MAKLNSDNRTGYNPTKAQFEQYGRAVYAADPDAFARWWAEVQEGLVAL